MIGYPSILGLMDLQIFRNLRDAVAGYHFYGVDKGNRNRCGMARVKL